MMLKPAARQAHAGRVHAQDPPGVVQRQSLRLTLLERARCKGAGLWRRAMKEKKEWQVASQIGVSSGPPLPCCRARLLALPSTAPASPRSGRMCLL